MFTVIGFMGGGICIGYLLRRRHLTHINRIITALIWLLLFLLGIEVGENQKIIQGLATLGMEAFIITLAAVLGSCLSAKILWIWLNKNRKNNA